GAASACAAVREHGRPRERSRVDRHGCRARRLPRLRGEGGRPRAGARASGGAAHAASRQQRGSARRRRPRSGQSRGGRAPARTRRRRPGRLRRRRPARSRRRRRVRSDPRGNLAPTQGLPQLQVGLLRLLQEPLRELVLDAALRQPAEDARLPEQEGPPVSEAVATQRARAGRRSLRWQARAPLVVAAARLRGHAGRAILVAAGIAASIAMLVGVEGGSLIARDRAVQRAVSALPASQQTFRVDAFGLAPGQTYAEADRTIRGTLASLTTRRPLRAMFFRELRVAGGLVQLASLDDLGALARLRSGRLPRTCVPARCEVLQLGAGGRTTWGQQGIHLVRVGTGELRDRALFGDLLAPAPQLHNAPVTPLVASAAAAFDRLPAFEGIYRSYSWIAPLDPRALHVWQISALQRRESRAQASLARYTDAYELSGPDAALTDASAKGRITAQRMVLIGGEVSTLLLGFALVCAIGLRRGLAAERRRLLERGARRPQLWLAVGAEVSAMSVAGGLVGVAAGAALVLVVAGRAGLPAGAVLGHSLGSGLGVALVLLAWLAGTAAVLVAGRAPSSARSGVRLLDVAALGAAVAVGVGLARGRLDANTLATGGDATLLLLLPGLVAFVAAVVAGRLIAPLMRAAERAARRGPSALRLALLALARAPSRTIATAAFLLVSVGLALFAGSYRATLERSARDEAAFAVPLDYVLSEGSQLVLPLDAAPLERYRTVGTPYPVLRRSATVVGSGTSFLNPTL